MTTRMLAALAFLGATAAIRVSMESGVWGPSDLDMVSKALDAVLATPHLSKEQLTSAQSVAVKVRGNLKAVESGKLKGEARKQKVGEAIAALTGLEQEWADWTKKSQAAIVEKEASEDAHIAELKKELAEKEALMVKDKDELKVLDLEKDLMQKKLKLNTLMEKKEAMAAQKAKEQEEKERAEVFKTLEALSTNSTSADAKKAALAQLQARVKTIQDAIVKIGEDEKADMKKFDALKLDAKGTKMLVSVKKKNHREHAKEKALKNAELGGLEKAIQNVEKGDANGVKESLKKMKSDAKKAEAKSGDFLH